MSQENILEISQDYHLKWRLKIIINKMNGIGRLKATRENVDQWSLAVLMCSCK